MSVARAVIDEASRSDRDRARALLAMAVQQRLTDPSAMRRTLARLGPVHQSVLLHVTIDDVEGGAHSLPELRNLEVLRASGLPVPDLQALRRRPDGRYYLDCHWQQYGVAEEVDGSHHRNAAAWEDDVLRQDELVIGGLVIVRILSGWVRDRPKRVVDLMRRALISRGWRP